MLAAAQPSWGPWVLILMVTLASSGVALATPWPMKAFVDQVAGGTRVHGVLGHLPGAGSRGTLLVWVVAAELVIFGLASALDVALTTLWVRVGQGLVYRFSAQLFERIQRRSLGFHRRTSTGDSLSRVTGDAWVINNILDGLLFSPLHAGILAVAMLGIMASIDVRLTIVGLAAVPMVGALAFTFSKPILAAGRRRRIAESSMQAHVQQTLAGVAVVQAFGLEIQQRRRFVELAADDVRAQKQAVLAQQLNGLGRGLATAVVGAAVLWLGANEVLHHRLSLGTLLVFVAYVGSLHEQFTVLSGLPSEFQAVRASIERVLEVLEAEPEVVDRPGAVRLGRVSGGVCFEGVSFGYEPGRPVLRDVSLEVAAGETVAVVGATGAGKSTLVGLVLRLHDPWAGRVLVDGRDVREVELAGLRAQVGLVLQESFLFPVSIAENIAYGRPGADRAAVVAAARVANADGFISGLPDGYDTVVGDRGATLSGGERQRVAIARAVLKDAPVLVLDEPTSALDAGTEAEVMGALRALMAGRTTFVIAHRLSTVRHADRVVVLDGGRVVECGAPGELLARGGIYAHLHTLATGGR